MAFRKKVQSILSQSPDLLIIPECEHPEKLLAESEFPQVNNSLWFGTNKNKGLGIFSFGEYHLKLKKNHNAEYKTIVPIAVKGPYSFELYAIWANNPGDPDGQYVTQVWKAINHYKKQLLKGDVLLIGDFNSNRIWDKPRRNGNHTHVVEYLEKMGIQSTYHRHHGMEQGKEAHPTFYLYKNKTRPYHIDYCFASENLSKNLTSVEVGKYDSWRHLSDHVPLIVNFNKR